MREHSSLLRSKSSDPRLTLPSSATANGKWCLAAVSRERRAADAVVGLLPLGGPVVALAAVLAGVGRGARVAAGGLLDHRAAQHRPRGGESVRRLQATVLTEGTAKKGEVYTRGRDRGDVDDYAIYQAGGSCTL